jgi:chemotaxis methyl-accepting protein methylase/mannose-6-phosphate isomerase-like protein (cupin superfamily)
MTSLGLFDLCGNPNEKELNDVPYALTLPASASFTSRGLMGYAFGPLKQKDLEILYVESEKGHDVFMVSKKITRIYYVLSGSGYFTIDNHRYEVTPGMLVEAPPKVEYCYSGKMTMLVVCTPRWIRGNDQYTKWNPDVVRWASGAVVDDRSWLTRLVRWRVFGKSPVGGYLRFNEYLWNRLPKPITAAGPAYMYANVLHALAKRQAARTQAFSTYFLRNRPQLELMRRLIKRRDEGEALKVAVLGCSTGAEAYSVAWTIRSACPGVKLLLTAADISKQAVEFASRGVYSLRESELTDTKIFDRMTAQETEELFDRDGGEARVKSWVKEGISWQVADAGDPATSSLIGLQEMVVANNFLCHMSPADAERCLRNIASLVRPNGYLIVSGIDPDVRAKVARDLRWTPLQELLEEIHDADPSCREKWPCHYGGLEPLNKRRKDWRTRYATAFQLPAVTTTQAVRYERELATA